MLAVSALAASAAADCATFTRIEPTFLHYRDLIEPDSLDTAVAVAGRVRLDLGPASGLTYLRQFGLSPSQAGAQELVEAVEGMRELANLWLSGRPLDRRERRRHAKLAGKMKTVLLDSGCFPHGVAAANRDWRDAPQNTSGRAGYEGRNLSRLALDSAVAIWEEPPPLWEIAAYLSVPALLIAGWQLYLHRRRKLEQRGHRRQIFSGRLVVEADGAVLAVTVLDIGRGGAKIRREDSLGAARRIYVLSAEYRIPTILSWQNAYYMGLSFHTPVSRATLRAILVGPNENGARGRRPAVAVKPGLSSPR